jgi:hypothetical protein
MSSYPDGSVVKVGDRVRYSGEGHEDAGVVVCDITAGVYSEAFPNSDWAFLEAGFLVQFERAGIIHFSDLVDEDLTLVMRQEQAT